MFHIKLITKTDDFVEQNMRYLNLKQVSGDGREISVMATARYVMASINYLTFS
jgi:hypothetical protein